jgi:hypothetical protein
LVTAACLASASSRSCGVVDSSRSVFRRICRKPGRLPDSGMGSVRLACAVCGSIAARGAGGAGLWSLVGASVRGVRFGEQGGHIVCGGVAGGEGRQAKEPLDRGGDG